MNKKLFYSFIFMQLIWTVSLYGQDLNLQFYSSILDGDSKNDYSGVAVAVYLDKSEVKQLENKIKSIGREFDKLTKNNYWLCWKALNEWEIEDGENYLILCAKNMNSDNLIMIIATIKENGSSFSWWGKAISSKDIE